MSLVVVTPAYQAERHLARTVGRLLDAGVPGLDRIVVVDDGSRDGTLAVATGLASEHAQVQVVARGTNGGYGAAMKDGLRAARDAGAEVVACVHADGQYGPEVLPGLLAALHERGLDVLQGSRIASGTARSGGMPRYKILGNALVNGLEKRVLGLDMTDLHSGLLVYGLRALRELPFDRLSDSFDFDLEVLAAARARGLSVGEEPIPTHYGDEDSHLNPVTYAMRVMRVLWRFRRGRYARP